MIETLKCSAYTLVYPHHFQMLKYDVHIGKSAIDNKERQTKIALIPTVLMDRGFLSIGILVS